MMRQEKERETPKHQNTKTPNWDQPGFTSTKTNEAKRVKREKSKDIQVLFVRVSGLRSVLLFFEDNETNLEDSAVTPQKNQRNPK